jgi:L-threonylcarbamoyladenylate synthase
MAKTLNVSRSSILKCAKALSEGKAIIYPTETVYGLGVDATNEASVRELFSIKSRDPRKSISVAVADVESARKLAYFNSRAEALAHYFLPGPLTLVLRARTRMPLITTGGKIGIRIPDNKFVLGLLKEFGKPMTSTSANLSGSGSIVRASDADEELLRRVSIIVKALETKYLKESTVVDVTNPKIKILREGAISKSDIMGAIGRVEA